MAQTTTIARPYAEAVFDLAREQDALPAWSDALDLAAAVVGDERVGTVLRSPRVADEQKAELIIGVGGEYLGEHARNLVRLLIQRDRIRLLPEIARQYRALRAEHERTLEARLITAQSVDEDVRGRLEKALSERLERKVTLASEIDETLIGGAIVRAGDMVIDGSVRGRLTRLTGALSR